MMNDQKQLLLLGMKLTMVWCFISFCVAPVWAADVHIQHIPVRCMLAGYPIEIVTHVRTKSDIVEARLYFKTPEANDFYFIRLQSTTSEEFTGLLPAPQPNIEEVRYQVLFVDQDGQAVKSPLFAVKVARDAEACPQTQQQDIPPDIPVFAESSLSPEIGFSADYLVWKLGEENALPTPYLEQAKETEVVPALKAAAPSKKFHIGKKTAIGLGAGVGIAAAIGLAAGGGGGGSGSLWGSLDDVTDDVAAELIKTPEIQTSCGTVVANQLFVTNNSATEVFIGTIDYEIVLTTDDPKGSCAQGQTGAFAPNLATVIPVGESLLIREWANEVNPCSGCPYLVAECVWKSRYIVHTSAGSAAAYASFTTEGDLCGTSLTAKPLFEQGNQIQGDIQP